MRYADRTAAGHALAVRLARVLSDKDGDSDTAGAVILALPRGGVPVAVPIARALGLSLDVLVVRKLGVPWQPELAMGAVGPGGVRVLQQDVIARAGISREQLERATQKAERERAASEEAFRAGRPPLDLSGRTAALIDDGLATGASMLAAIRVARALQAARVIAAAPVGASTTIERLRHEADMVVVDQSVGDLRAVGHWYDDFTQVPDQQVQDLLERG